MQPQMGNESEVFVAVFARVSSFGAAAPLVLECSTHPLCSAHAHHKAPANAALAIQFQFRIVVREELKCFS